MENNEFSFSFVLSGMETIYETSKSQFTLSGKNMANGSTVRSKIKKIEIAMINTLQLAARKNVIQMSLQW
jgi:hypothetical protein